MADLYLPRDSYEVKAGEKCKLVATPVYEQNEKERKQILIWDEQHGYVDQKGLFSAPILEQDTTFTVNVRRQEEPDEARTISVLVIKTEKKESDKRINEWEVLPIGDEGNYSIRVQLFDQNKQGIKGEVVFTDVSTPTTLPSILPDGTLPDGTQGPRKEITEFIGDKGYIKVNLKPFQEKQRCIHVDCKSTGLDKFLELSGPKPLKPRAKFDPKAGFLANLTQNFPEPVQQQKHLLRRRK